MMGSREAMPVISVVVPVYNESEVLHEFYGRLAAVLDQLDFNSEVIFVNDGSTDRTLSDIKNLRAKDARIALIDLSRNFGKEIAMTAGLDAARGEAVVVIDADLQDPPELIPDLVREWRQGNDVVYARRVSREHDSIPKRLTAHVFYRLIRRVSRVEIPADTGDFRLLSRRAIDALGKLREHHRFMKGLFSWIGFRQAAVPYSRSSRAAGTTKYDYWRLWNFALEGITSFTIAPLKIASYVGLFVSIGAFLYAAWVLVKTLLWGEPVAGFPTLIIVILLLGGLQLAALGVIGEYLGRTFNESKRRPLYFVQEYVPSEPPTRDSAERTSAAAYPTRE